MRRLDVHLQAYGREAADYPIQAVAGIRRITQLSYDWHATPARTFIERLLAHPTALHQLASLSLHRPAADPLRTCLRLPCLTSLDIEMGFQPWVADVLSCQHLKVLRVAQTSIEK